MSWNSEFKLAIINENLEEIENLLSTMPKFSSIEEMNIASSLTTSAMDMIKERKNLLYAELTKLRNVKKYIQ